MAFVTPVVEHWLEREKKTESKRHFDKNSSVVRSFMVDPLSYFLWYLLSFLWDDAYKKKLAASGKE